MSSRQPTPDLFADPSASAPTTITDPIVEATVAAELAQLSYDYRSIDDADLAGDAQAAAVRIKTKQRRAAADIIAIGEDLHAIKQRLPHGQFGMWIQVEFGMADRTAQNYMLLATEYGGNAEPLAMLGQTVALLAARPSTPDGAKAALLDAAETAKADGGKLTKTQAEAIVAEHKDPPRPMNLDQHIALVWRAIKTNNGPDSAHRLRWLNEHSSPELYASYYDVKVWRLSPGLLKQAVHHIGNELRHDVERAALKAAKTALIDAATNGPLPSQGRAGEGAPGVSVYQVNHDGPDPTLVQKTPYVPANNQEGLPADLAAAGWELRRLPNDGAWWVLHRAGSRSTGTHIAKADAISEAYDKQIDLADNGPLPASGRAGVGLPADPLDDVEPLLLGLLGLLGHGRLILTVDLTDGYKIDTFDPAHGLTHSYDSLAAAIDACRPVESEGSTP